MANGIELTKAYVQIIPSTEGFAEKLKSEMEPAGEKAGGFFSKGFGGAGKVITAVTAAGLAAATTAVTNLTVKALEAGAAFETAFAQVQTIMDTTAMSVDEMSSGIMSLSNEMGISTEELSNTVYNVISATGDTANALEIAGSAAKLATAGFTDSGSALSVLTTAMNAYGLAADQVEHISDSLIMVQNLGVTTVAELSSSMGKAIASASAYGVNLENVEATYVSMTKAGINTAEATTYMSSMMKELGDSGTDAAKLLKEKTGKSFAELMGDGKSLADVLEVLYKAEGENATALMNLWSSAEAGKAANAVLGQGFETFNENLAQISTTAGVTQTAFETMENTMSAKIAHVKNSWTNLLAGMGSGSVDFTGLMDSFVGDFMNVFNALTPQIPVILNGIVSLITTMVPQLLAQIGPVLTQNMPIIFNSILTIASSIFTMLATELPNLVSILIPMLPGLISMMTTAFIQNLPVLLEGIAQLVAQLVEHLPEILSAIWDAIVLLWDTWIVPALEKIGDFFSQVWESISAFFSDIWQGIVDFFSPIVEWFDTNIITPLKNFFTKLWQGIVNAWNTVIGPWIEIAKRLWDKIREGAAAAWEGIKNIWNVVSGWFTEKIVDPIKNFFTGMWDGLKEGASKAWEGIKNVFQPVVDWFKNVFKKAWEGVKNVFSTGGKIFSGIKEGLEKVFKTVVNAIIRGLNTIIAAPFDTINWIFGKLRGINILGVSPFSWLGSLTVPKIPELAKGGILTGPTLMLGGEDGSEAVIPLERNTEWIRAVAVEMDEATDNSEVDVLEDILEKLDNMRIYLDTGKLVGGISGRMDGALGDNAGMRQRGVALA